MEDDALAQIIKQKVAEGDMLDYKKKNELKDINKNNLNKIRQQMVENEEKRKYGILMTEHERRVNDKDIQAYQD